MSADTLAPVLEVTLFDTPSGDVRGIVIATLPQGDHVLVLAHATLRVDDRPLVTTTIPKKLTVGEVLKVAEVLQKFAVKVQALETPFVEGDAENERFVIQFDNGAYNWGPGDANGIEAGFEEASRYSREEVVEKVKDLVGVTAILSVGTEQDGCIAEQYARVDPTLAAHIPAHK